MQEHTPIDATTRDKTSPVWDMSQERAFIETLLNQRFNFFLVVFSLAVAGVINSKGNLQLSLVLSIGAAITALLASTLARSQEKLGLILADLRTDPSHPVSIIDSRARKGGSRMRIVGIWIPRLCSGTLIVGAALAWLGVFTIKTLAP